VGRQGAFEYLSSSTTAMKAQDVARSIGTQAPLIS
jgi:hypothetical protein